MTRVIAGAFRGRRLAVPPGGGLDVRPTSDRTKTILFDVLGPLDEDLEVLDLYAGTGALGIEALSRGARTVTFVELAAGALRLLRENVSRLGLEARARVVRADALDFAKRAGRHGERWTLVLADPPYARSTAERVALATVPVIAPGGWLALEHAAEDPLPERVPGLTLRRSRRVGRTMLAFYERSEGLSTHEEG